jgi:hypothetical protein
VAELRAFRNVLCANDALRDRYEALKRNLAKAFRDDREAYGKAKPRPGRGRLTPDRDRAASSAWTRLAPGVGKTYPDSSLDGGSAIFRHFK